MTKILQIIENILLFVLWYLHCWGLKGEVFVSFDCKKLIIKAPTGKHFENKEIKPIKEG